MFRSLYNKWKESRAQEIAQKEAFEKLFEQAQNSKVQVRAVVVMQNGDRFPIEKEICGLTYRNGLGDSYRHARVLALEFFRDLCKHVSTNGYTLKDRSVHFLPHMIAKVELESIVDL